ncbi:PAS domain S-box protein [Paracraurococcus lichenis]|uniref:histidine kinase n=1 Tax=Paracraurococcus lichenis TaxID=3064888 RepID=A0ABT9E9G9_9PROT|nr:PAS domain S-box protein [Paracraurococcus sp. LOR1-02]MDO9712851.1 PAS domain S-box protein [Paracraurococcus sp. LOR1-02]
MVETVLASPEVSSLACGPERILIYNDAAARLYGARHPLALGRPMQETFPEGWATVAPLYARAFAGEVVQVAAQPLDTRGEGEAADAFDAMLMPVRDDAGVVTAVHMMGQEVGTRLRAEAALRDSEARLAANLAGMRQLYDLHARLARQTDLMVALRDILRAACGFTGTDRGTVQLVSSDGERLEIVAEHGYPPDSPFVAHFRHEGFAAGCDAARRQHQRLVIEDTRTFPGLVGTADGEAALADGILAAQSTPMVTRSGEMVGVLSTQFRHPHRPTEEELRLVDLLAWSAAEFVERYKADAALRASEERLRALVTATSYAVYSMSPDWMELRRLDGHGFLADTPEPSRSWLDEYILPEDQPQVWDAIQEAIRARRVFDLEHRVRRAAGGFGWAHSRAVPLLDAEGRIREWFGAASDVTARRAVEEALRASEERLRRVLETDAVAVLFFRYDGLLIDANDVFLRMSGWSRKEVEGGRLHWRTMTPPEWVADSEAQMEAFFRTGRVGPYEKEYLCKDGSRTWILFSGRDLGDGTVVEVAIDITGRKRAEAALRESEERLRQFGEASSDVLWIRDAETLQWEYLSPAFEAIYGLRRDAALAGEGLSSWTDLIVEEDRAHAVAGIARVGAGERVTFEYRVRRPDGGIRWLRNTDFPICGSDGTVRRIGGVGQDVTELKRTEAALREEEARLRALVEGIPQLVWRSGEGGLWTWSSPQWRDHTGQSDERSRGLGWLDVLHPDDRDAARVAWRVAGPNGRLQVDCRIRHAASGRYAWFQIRGTPVRDHGWTAEWIGSCTDIDDQVRAREVLARAGAELEARVAERTAELMAAEESLRQAQKMEAVGQLTGGIAHDFNNMLQGVVGGVAMARRQISQGHADMAMRYLDAAHDAVGRAAGLTRRLLAFARRQRLEPRLVDADGLVAGLADLVRRTVGPGIAVELTLRGGAGAVLCDPNELESALLNLCINARDAMPEGGRLTIRTELASLSAADIPEGQAAPGTYVGISVADTGTGMPPGVLARVFEPFFTTKPQGQGTGLGLSQVYGFARQSDGLVRIESVSGQGTTVRLLLPVHEGDATVATAPGCPSSPVAGPSGTVLLVDDEDAVRRPVADRLRELGLSVLEARDGPEALRVLATARPDLLVTDVGLPGGMNGRQLAEAVRERIPELSVLFVTGYAGTALPSGVEVIGKPFELDVLAHRVQALLQARQQEWGGNPRAAPA